MSDLANKEHRQWATQAVERFVGRFDESYRLLAYHAALPLVLTPELVNYLRNQFLRGEQVPWVAEVDLLLSELCSQVGYELYAMDTHVREYLLEQMEQDSRFGEPRMREVAQVLISYVNYLSRLNPERRKQEIEAQRLAAMVYLGDEECKTAAREIAESLLEISSGTRTGSENLDQSEIRAQLARLTRITEELSRPLQKREQKSLLKYARLVQQILRNPERVNPDELHNSFHVEGVELRFTDKFLPETLAKTLVAPRNKVVQFPGFPPIKTFTFEVAIFEEGTNNLQPLEFEVALIEVNQFDENNTDTLLEMLDQEVFKIRKEYLNDIQKLIVQGVLDNLTYEQIATASDDSIEYPKHIAPNLWKYLRNHVAPNLWKLLSQVLGEKVIKRNLKKVIKQWAISRKITIRRERKQGQYFTEDLGDEVGLDMLFIPGGTFMMGSPEEELESYDDERPQHQVTVPSFYMGRYPITQAQWREVVGWEQVERKLERDPSSFKENYEGIDRWTRPVEQVSWEEAKEFCDRLSRKTGKEYRLPTEAEWEYACRAGTNTPFHFGETISTELANYYGEATYGRGVEGENREQTTPVGYFQVANNFGLSDMHGNVWEWCEDDWHENYEKAPNNGSAWLSENSSAKVRRGGSWSYFPLFSRSACRFFPTRDVRIGDLGFRVVCVAPRTT